MLAAGKGREVDLTAMLVAGKGREVNLILFHEADRLHL